jgi:hypothetical protein
MGSRQSFRRLSVPAPETPSGTSGSRHARREGSTHIGVLARSGRGCAAAFRGTGGCPASDTPLGETSGGRCDLCDLPPGDAARDGSPSTDLPWLPRRRSQARCGDLARCSQSARPLAPRRPCVAAVRHLPPPASAVRERLRQVPQGVCLPGAMREWANPAARVSGCGAMWSPTPLLWL